MSKICCFAGHREIYNEDSLCENVKILAEKLIVDENVEEFMVGNYGAFDKLAAKAVRYLKEIYPDIRLNLIIPYLTYDINEYKEMYYKNYDEFIMADIPEKTPGKCKILKCNQYMVNKSDFIICYVKNNYGGAAKTLQYAKSRQHIKVLNLGE